MHLIADIYLCTRCSTFNSTVYVNCVPVILTNLIFL